MDITFKWTGDLEKSLREISGRVVETRKLLEPVAKRIRYSMQLNIAQGRTPENEPFPPLKRPIRKKLRKGDPRPLIDTGNLINSFAYKFVSDREVQIGDPTKYGIYHNFGTSHVPVREFIGIRPDDRLTLDRYLGNWTAWAFGVYDADTSQLVLDFNN